MLKVLQTFRTQTAYLIVMWRRAVKRARVALFILTADFSKLVRIKRTIYIPK